MIQKIKKGILSTFIPAVLAAFMIPTMAFAAESCTVTIPATVSVSGSSIPSGTVYTLVMEAVTEAAPMPEETTVSITGAGTVSFGPITYTVPGDYQYKIYQNSAAVNRFTYDSSEYTVTVRILNDGNGSLVSEVWAVSSADPTTKPDTISFANTYSKASSGGSSHSGGSSSGGSSSSGSTAGSNSGPGVSSSGSGDSSGDPGTSGELTPIGGDPGILGALPQTGTLWWIVPILVIAGVLLLTVGFKSRRRED